MKTIEDVKVNLGFLKENHSEVSKSIRSIMYFILIVILYFFLVLNISPQDMMENGWVIRLPFFGTNINKTYFLIAGPITLYLMFLYLHTFIDHKRKIETQINQNIVNEYFRTTEKYPAIFNMNNKLPLVTSMFFFYWLIPIVILFFLVKSFKEPTGYFYIVGVITAISICTSTWKTVIYITNRVYKPMAIFSLVFLEFIFILFLIYSSNFVLEKPKYKYDLYRVNLAGENLYGKDLSNTNFQNAILNTANLEHAVLNNSCFVDAIMNNCILNYAKMKEVDMSGASVNHSSLIKVDFGKGSVFKHTQFHQSILIGAGLKSAKLNGAGLRSALSWAIMDSADLRYADAVGAKMVGTKLRKADLTHLTLEGAVLIKAELMESDLTKANLHKALLHGANLSNTKLINSNLTYAKLNPINSDDFPWETYKYGDENDKFIFPEIQYHGPTGPAIMNGCDFSGTKLEKTILIGVDLRGVKNIGFKEIIKAIGNESTKLPDYLKNREDTIRKAWHDNIINDE